MNEMKNYEMLLNEEEFQAIIEALQGFAERNNLTFSDDSVTLVELMTHIIKDTIAEPDSLAMGLRFIYNLGYRDDVFDELVIH